MKEIKLPPPTPPPDTRRENIKRLAEWVLEASDRVGNPRTDALRVVALICATQASSMELCRTGAGLEEITQEEAIAQIGRANAALNVLAEGLGPYPKNLPRLIQGVGNMLTMICNMTDRTCGIPEPFAEGGE